jgi:hypothetical protein
MRASRGGSLALPAFLGPTHENLLLTSTLPPFGLNPVRRLDPIWLAIRDGRVRPFCREPREVGVGQEVDIHRAVV